MQQKGQIQIVLLALAVIVIILWTTGLPDFKLDFSSQSPTFQPQTNIYVPETELRTVPVPTIVDVYPPSRSNLQPTGLLSAQTRKVIMSLSTTETATCKYSTVSGVAYESMQNTFTDTDDIFHMVLLTTLSEGEGYIYYVKCMDLSGNKNTDDSIIAFMVKEPTDFTPPKRFNIAPSGALPYSTTETTIMVSTDEPADCRYSTGQGYDYTSMSKSLTPEKYKRHHTAHISGLQYGVIYEFFVRCQDMAGNKNTGDVMIRFGVGTQ